MIGTLNEKPLHAALKRLYAQPGDRTEVRTGAYIVDVVRGDLLIEIQTRHVSAIRAKLAALAQDHCVRLVLPIAQEKWIVRLGDDGVSVIGRRRSPRRGAIEWLFDELVSIPQLLAEPNFSLDAVMIQEEEVRYRDDGVNWRRHGWAVAERRLLGVVEHYVFEKPGDLARLLPADLPEPFTARQLAAAIGQPVRLGQRMAYCLREAGLLVLAGTQGRSHLYARAAARS